MIQYFLSFVAALIVGTVVNSSIKVVSGGDEAVVERLNGRHRPLKPGVRFLLPLVEKVVHYDTTRERFLDIQPQEVITHDNIPLTIDAIVYWKIEDIEKSYYEVDKIDDSIANLVLTTLRAKVATVDMRELLTSVNEVNEMLLKTLDEATANWGVKILRVNLQSVQPPESLVKAMEKEKTAESQKRAELSVARTEAESIELLSEALRLEPNQPEFLQYLIAKHYVEAHEKVSTSANSKVVFMNPGQLNEALTGLMEDEQGSPQDAQSSRRLKIVGKPSLTKETDDNIGNNAG